MINQIIKFYFINLKILNLILIKIKEKKTKLNSYMRSCN